MVLDKYYTVVVERIAKVGVIVRMTDSSTELIHISNISDKYVANISDYVTVGDTFNAKCVTGKDGSLQLSLKHLNLPNKSAETKSSSASSNPYPCHSNQIKHLPQSLCVSASKNSHSTSADLDKMIEKAQQDYVDKTAHKDSGGRLSQKSRRKSRNKPDRYY